MRHLYTWRDVEREAQSVPDAPWECADADASEIRVHYRPGRIEDCKQRLIALFGSALNASCDTVRLMSIPGTERSVTVVLAPAGNDAIPAKRVMRPLWSSAGLIGALPGAAGDPSVSAFFSYKGGVGRTTLALGLLGEFIGRQSEPKVLIVDADFEAPGLTWLLTELSEERFSFADALALLHDTDDWQADALPLIAEQTQANRRVVELSAGRREFYFLPAVRTLDQLFLAPVTPEQLIRGRGRAWLLGDFLIALGRQLCVDAVIVDTRAGVSEFSSPLLLDPRVSQVLVTSCNPQSVAGTVAMLTTAYDRLGPQLVPEVVVSLVPPDRGDELYQDVCEELISAWPAPVEGTDEGTGLNLQGFHRAGFAQEILHYPSVDELLRLRLPGTDVAKRAIPELAACIMPETSVVSKPPPPSTVTPAVLAAEAERLEFAEANATQGLLPIPALESLARACTDRLPASVVMGSKGAGKTFAWGQMVIAGTWGGFLKLLNSERAGCEARVFPLLAPKSVRDQLLGQVQGAESRALAGRAGGLTRDELRQELEQCTGGDVDGLRFWLKVIARRLALPGPPPESATALVSAVASSSGSVVLVVDGLEEAFQVAADKPLSEAQRKILRALLQDMPNALREANQTTVGLVTFVRRDLAIAAISQNFHQFEALHKETSLYWSPADALRLPLWLLERSGWGLLERTRIPKASYEDAREALVPFWGVKLGGKKEAFTDKWVIAALSDLNRVMQARDMIRLIRYSCENAGRSGWPLPPRAIRDALPKVSEVKIRELEQEVPALTPIFAKLRAVEPASRQVPFAADELRLTPEDTKFLEQHGLVTKLGDSDRWYMPEIVRHGLSFRLGGPGRAKVLALYRAATARASP